VEREEFRSGAKPSSRIAVAAKFSKRPHELEQLCTSGDTRNGHVMSYLKTSSDT
jgi:hypothetical protein